MTIYARNELAKTIFVQGMKLMTIPSNMSGSQKYTKLCHSFLALFKLNI